MEQGETPVRVISLEEATQAFGMQLELFSPLMEEVAKLSDGKIGVLRAVLDTCANGISFDPMAETTPKRIRELVGAPEQDSELEGWREQFYNDFMVSRENLSH